MKKVRQTAGGKTYVHAEHILTDITLCGQALEGDSSSYEEDRMSEAKKVSDKTRIDCPDCIKIIRYCKGAKQ